MVQGSEGLQFLDAQEQNGDPQTNPVITNDKFTGASLRPFPIGGPYNFGEFDPNEVPTKRGFLGTTVPGSKLPATTIVIPDGNRPFLGLPLAPSFTILTGTPTKPELVVGADIGGGPRVQIFSGSTFALVNNFFAFEPTFTGGVRVATADINGDGKAEVVLVPVPGGAARPRILRGPDLTPLEDFYSLDPQFTGGAFVG